MYILYYYNNYFKNLTRVYIILSKALESEQLKLSMPDIRPDTVISGQIERYPAR